MIRCFLIIFSAFFVSYCGLDGQVLATYSGSKIKRKEMREIIAWYGLEESMKNVVSQKILVKQIAVTRILSKEASALGLHRSDSFIKYDILMRKKSLARMLLSYWRKAEEEKPEKLYQTESIILSKDDMNDSSNNSPLDKSESLNFIKEVHHEIKEGNLRFSDSSNYAKKRSKTIKYFNLEYLPANAMENSYQQAVFQLDKEGQSLSEPISNPYGWQLIRLNDTVLVEKNDFSRYFKDETRSDLGNLYWNRTLKFRNIDWKKYLFKKYDIELESLPPLPDVWRKKQVLFKNKKLQILSKDFRSFQEMKLTSVDTPKHSFSSKSQPNLLFKDFLELIIFSSEAERKKLNLTEEYKRLEVWEKNNFLVREYTNKFWLGNGLQNHSRLESSQKDRIEKEKVLLKEYNFQIMDNEFRQNFI